jgi:hypothetical protein
VRVADAPLQQALLASTKRCAARMNVQAVANTLLSLSKLLWPMAEDLRMTLSSVAGARAPEMNAQQIANTLLALATLRTGLDGNDLRQVCVKCVYKWHAVAHVLEHFRHI